jgi:hypothetical protein
MQTRKPCCPSQAPMARTCESSSTTRMRRIGALFRHILRSDAPHRSVLIFYRESASLLISAANMAGCLPSTVHSDQVAILRESVQQLARGYPHCAYLIYIASSGSNRIQSRYR